MQDIAAFIINNGIGVAALAYFIYKDYTVTRQNTESIVQNTEILKQVKTMLDVIIKRGSDNDGM